MSDIKEVDFFFLHRMLRHDFALEWPSSVENMVCYLS